MKFRRNKRSSAEVNAGALSDILFFLLLFFLIVSTLAGASAVKVQLPSSSQGKSIPRHPINISITEDLKYYVDRKEIPHSSLVDVITTEAQSHENASVVLRVDKNVSVQYMIEVMDIVNQLKIPIVVATEKKQP